MNVLTFIFVDKLINSLDIFSCMVIKLTACGTSGLMYVLVTYFTGLPWLISCTYRAKLRSMFGLPESPAPDWIVHCLCELCAICQEYRELQARGLDPSIGT